MQNDDLPYEVHGSHLGVLKSLLQRVETHLLTSEDVKVTYGDYLRVLQFFQESGGEQPPVLKVEWVDSKDVRDTCQ